MTQSACRRLAERTLKWGASGPNDYGGELDVDPADDESASRLTVRLHTERVEGRAVEDGLDEVLQGLKRAVEQAESH